MKKLLLLLAAVGMIFTACEPANGLDEDNNGNNTEQPGGGNGSNNGDNSGNTNDPNNPLNNLTCAPNEILYIAKYFIIELGNTQGFGGNLVYHTFDENRVGKLIFDNDITTIPANAFKDCSAMVYIKYPETITTIEDNAFSGCSSLKNITIPDSVTSIGKNAFRDCAGELTVNCNIPSARSYEYGAFLGSKFTSVTIGDSVTSIGAYAFYHLKSLQSITIGNSVTEIGMLAFSSCSSLTRVEFGNNLTSVGEKAFYDCTGEVIVNCNIHGVWWHRVFDESKFTKLTIGNSVTSIGDYAFGSCDSLISVTIGNGVTSIGEDAFRYCDSLTSVYCKPTTPPTGGSDMLYSNASGRKIYVPRNSVSAYKAAEYWRDYADYIVGYDFE